MTRVATFAAAWLALSITTALALARLFRSPNSLGGTPTAAVEGMARPDEAAGTTTALPDASRTSSLPADPLRAMRTPPPQQQT